MPAGNQSHTYPSIVSPVHFSWIIENQTTNISKTPLPVGFGQVWRLAWRPEKKEGIEFLAAATWNTSRVACSNSSSGRSYSRREGTSCSRQQWAWGPRIQVQLPDISIIPPFPPFSLHSISLHLWYLELFVFLTVHWLRTIITPHSPLWYRFLCSHLTSPLHQAWGWHLAFDNKF